MGHGPPLVVSHLSEGGDPTTDLEQVRQVHTACSRRWILVRGALNDLWISGVNPDSDRLAIFEQDLHGVRFDRGDLTEESPALSLLG